MQGQTDFGALSGQVVYVKTVDVADLPDDMRKEAGDLEQVYALHNDKGEQLALVSDRRMAYILARQNHLTPMTAH